MPMLWWSMGVITASVVTGSSKCPGVSRRISISGQWEDFCFCIGANGRNSPLLFVSVSSGRNGVPALAFVVNRKYGPS